MLNNQFVRVASCSNELEASNIAVFLNDNGIRASVESSVVSSLLNYGSALGDVKVLAAAEDEELAAKLLDRLRQDPPENLDAWRCPNCHEAIEGGFDTCWKCSLQRPANVKMVQIELEPVDTAAVRDSESEFTLERTDQLLSRALYTIIFGILILPIISQIYALYLLFALPTPFSGLSGRQRTKWYLCFGILFFQLVAIWFIFAADKLLPIH